MSTEELRLVKVKFFVFILEIINIVKACEIGLKIVFVN